jgi:glutathione S-transferase
MKLYFFPGACSLACHIALRESGATFDMEKVDGKTKKTASGADYLAVNPKGYVPTLALDDGQKLTEAAAILQYVADQNPAAKLAPAAGSMERYRMIEWLNFIATEIHRNHTPLFKFAEKLPDASKQVFKDDLAGRFEWLAKQLEGKQYLLGDTFSIADIYLFTVLNWPRYVGMDIGKWPALKEYHKRIGSRPAVQAALLAEGLIKKAA